MTSEVTVPGDTVPEILKYWASTKENDVPAFVSIHPDGDKKILTRKEVYDCSKHFAHRLRSLGIGKDNIVCNTLPNSLERVICEFGIILSGATSMNGQVLRTDGEDFMEALQTSQCIAVIVDPGSFNSARKLLVGDIPQGCQKDIRSEAFPFLKHLIICARNESDVAKDFISSLKDQNLPDFVAEVIPTDIVTIMTTSGSTGFSKLVKFSHSNICAFGRQVKVIEPLKPGDRFMNCSQLGWAGGYPQWYLSCGVTRYFLDMHKGPYPHLWETLWRAIVDEKIVYAFLSPLYVNNILANRGLWENTSWKPRCLCLAGQPVKKATLDIIGKLCDTVDINYGMTECNLIATHRVIDSSSYTEGCAGNLGYQVQLKIVDKDFRESPQGTIGQILIKSPTLTQGYLNNEAACQKAFLLDGWFCTDDAGYMGQDGKLYVEGRQSDCIMRGTAVVYPGWLEKKLKEFPGVEDVVVVGVPDAVLYNEICGCVLVKVKGIQGTHAGLWPGKQTYSNNKLSGVSCDNSMDDVIPQTSNGNISNKAMKENGKLNCEKSMNSLLLESLENNIRSFANTILLPEFALIPKYYVFLETYPVTNNGKICRRELREIAANVLGLHN